MKTHDKKESGTLTLSEAMETLSSIAEMDFDYESEIAQNHNLIVKDKPLHHHIVHWLHNKDEEVTIDVVKSTFRVVLNYLRNYYEKEYNTKKNEQALEGIKTIMVLVGEAAKKLEKCTKTFNQVHNSSIMELKEYKKLQDFYLSHIARKIDEGMLGKWILALSNKIPGKEITLIEKKEGQSKHVFVDLESVKKDLEYELFFMRKEDGTRFFNPRLIRNVKLVSDFGGYFGEVKDNEPLTCIAVWQDRYAHMCAKNIVRSLQLHIDRFYRESAHYKDNQCVESLNKALMALMLCCNPHNLMHNLAFKDCRDYFYDFRYFLRESLGLVEYHKMITYAPKKSCKLAQNILNTAHNLCLALYTQITALQSLTGMVHEMIQQANDERSNEHQKNIKKYQLWSVLANDYAAMSKLLKRHPNGPINKILDALENGEIREFDPLIQGNIPAQLFTIYSPQDKIIISRWPSPTTQEFIHKVSVIDEFKGVLRACAHEHVISKCLVINFQDRTSWKEHYRCMAIEDLPNHESFARYIDVATLAKETEFYYQLEPYNEDNQAETFIQHFKEQFKDENCGNIIPKLMQKELSGDFIDGVLTGIHQIFFSGKNMLLKEHRMDFIEIFYLFLQLKIIELSKANIVGYTCKDSLDIAGSSGALLFVFLKLLHQERLSENDQEQLDVMLYAPCLLERERIMLPERFNRMLTAIKALEAVSHQLGHNNFVKTIEETFGKYYKTPILQSKVVVERCKDRL
jgi:hypothetical protein